MFVKNIFCFIILFRTFVPMTGIYKIQSTINSNRIYIGSAIDIKKRWNGHLRQLRSNCHHSKKLQNHVNKYGIDDLEFSIITACERDKLIINEQFFIDSYKPYFNCSPTAGNCNGIKRTEEHKKKISNKLKGCPPPIFSPETRAKISLGLKGRVLSETSKLKMKNAKLDKYNGSNNPFYGKKHSEEAKEKMSKANIGNIGFWKGKTFSQDTINKMSNSKIGKPTWNKGLKNYCNINADKWKKIKDSQIV